MNYLLEKGFITEMRCGTNFAYVLADNSQFSSTEYKVLSSNEEDVFVRLVKLLYNGQQEFYYLSSDYTPLSRLLRELDPDSFVSVAASIIASIITVKNNGFLSCKNIDGSFDKIFIDKSTGKVKLVYLPAKISFYLDDAAFENEFRSSLIRTIDENVTLSSPRTKQLMDNLSNGMMDLQKVYNSIKIHTADSTASSPAPQELPVKNAVPDVPVSGKRLKIVSLNMPEKISIPITKESFVIGKKAESVDGVVPGNKLISRVHCRIDEKQHGQYFITDLGSANGTYVNLVRIQGDEAYPIKNGDTIRLANSDFEVVLE